MNDDYNIKKHIANENLPGGFSLEDILAEYKAGGPEEKAESESLLDRTQRIVLDAIDPGLGEASFSTLDDIINDAVAEAAPPAAEPEPEPEPEPVPEPEPEEEPEPELSLREQAVIEELERERDRKSGLKRAAPSAAGGGTSEYQVRELLDADERERYASADAAGEEEKPGEDKPDIKERVLAPVIALLALLAMKRGERKKGGEQPPTVEKEDVSIPEMEPDKATKLYARQMGSLKLRGRIALGLCAVMVYLSFAYNSVLPLFGALKDNVPVISLLLLVLELSVIMTGLDVFTAGIMSLVRKSPGVESLAAASCLLSVLDAAVMGLGRMSGFGLPFCAVSALSLTFCIWGAYYTCRGFKTSFRVLTSSKRLYTVTGESGIAGAGVALLKSRESVYGFIRRSEEADLSEYVYGILTPVALLFALVLGAIASLLHGQPKAFFHCISVMTAASASFSAAICFALPFAITARKLYQSGAAIAGWTGAGDIGRSRHVVITDSDVFPAGTVEISSIRILEGAFTDKVISYTGSVIAASGNGLSGAFADLIKRNGYSISRVENFEPHDGGGMTAMVNGENVYVGNTGFMNLMGIRVPQKLNTKSSVYAAINGALVGIFVIDYKPTSSVQDALVVLLHSNREPVFALRDFNITPMMIKKKFRMPTDSFEFPSYSERFRISGARPGEDSRVAAVISREGMGPLVDAAERGRRLYSGVRAGTLLSAAGSVFGLVMMFFLCWAKAYDSATVSNVITFMLLWLIPNVVIAWGLQR